MEYHCKFSHNIERKEQTDNNSHPKQVQDTNVKPFLDEIKNLVGTVRSQFRMMAPFMGQRFPQAPFVPVVNQGSQHVQTIPAMAQPPQLCVGPQ